MIEKIDKIYSRIFKTLQYAKRDPYWFFMFIFSRFYTARKLFKAFSKNPDLTKFDLQKSIFTDLDVEEAVKSLNKDGFFRGFQLPIEILNELVTHGKSAMTYGNGGYSNGFLYADKARAEKITGQCFSFSSFFNLDDDCPLVQKIGSDPKLMMIAAKYFGSEPVHNSSRMWWNYATDEEKFDIINTSSFFHYDKDDFYGLRLFFYLTDVDSQSGPHVCILGSHQNKNLAQLLSLKERSDREMINMYGEEKLMTITGAAGSSFFEDPFCFHKGTRPKDKDRLMLTLYFATSHYKVFNSKANRFLLQSIFDAIPTKVGKAT